MNKKVKYSCSKRTRCSVCQKRLSMKVSLTDRLLRCSSCKVPYVQRPSGVFRAVKAKQIRKLRKLYKTNKSEFRVEMKSIDRYLLKPFRFDKKVSARERLIELWDNKPEVKSRKEKSKETLDQVRKRILSWRKKTK